MNSDYITNLFLSSSYREQLEDYNKILANKKNFEWDVVVITASNEKQAKTYEMQINKRKKNHLLPRGCNFIVIPDKDNKRIGSGGATLNVIKILKEKYINFDKLKILLMHSGGDSKRIPQYSMGGKLFSPVPRLLCPYFSSTLFDELLVMFCNVPARMNPGMLTICGDALLLFNPLQLDIEYKDLASITMKAPVSQGEHHGVLVEKNGIVDKFLHKCNAEKLRKSNAVLNEKVYIDTGMIYFSSKMLNKFIALMNDNYDLLTSDLTRLNLYGDILYPFAASSTLEDYLKEPAEGEMNDSLNKARILLWGIRDDIEYSIIKLSPAKFIHFGTSKELYELMVNNINDYESIGWKQEVNSSTIDGNVCAINSIIINSKINNSFVENSKIEDCSIGNNTIISNTNIKSITVPDNVCLSTTKVKNGYVTRIYGIDDDPKKKLSEGILGFDVSKVNSKYDLKIKLDETLWESELYSVSPSMSKSVDYALSLYKILSLEASKKEVTKWLASQRKSLSTSFNESVLTDKDLFIVDLIENQMIDSILTRKDLKQLCNYLKTCIYKDKIIGKLYKNYNNYSKYIKVRIGYILSELDNTERYDHLMFSAIKDTVSEEYCVKEINIEKVKDKVDIYLPVRLNFGGGWSDTPPYCLDNGGTVLNAAVKLNGILPIHVRIERIKDTKFIVETWDLGKTKEFTSSSEIYDCNDPNDSFALIKSAIVISGLVSKKDKELTKLFSNVKGGVKIITDVKNIPRGSGLGTSSILSGALVMALNEFMNIDKTLDEISDDVLKIEQLMSTGGGWQDQVGGIYPGIKLITSKPGDKQKLDVNILNIDNDFKKNFKDRFVLINTGQRRLARNLLREIVSKYVSNDKITLDVLSEIQKIAKKEVKAIEENNIKDFGLLLDKHWELIKKMDPESTNLCIDTIISTIDDLIYGKSLCGAGGGGFILAILKENVTKEDIQNKLEKIFADTDVQVWDIDLYEG